jgi:CrcB protein
MPIVLKLAAVFLGGGVGSVARYLTIIGCGRLCGTEFPWGTVAVNVIGSFIMGVLVELFAKVWSASEATRVLLTVGFLGGYTTFSTFSLDVALLVERGTLAVAAGYMAISVAFSIAGIFAGLLLFRWLLP